MRRQARCRDTRHLDLRATRGTHLDDHHRSSCFVGHPQTPSTTNKERRPFACLGGRQDKHRAAGKHRSERPPGVPRHRLAALRHRAELCTTFPSPFLLAPPNNKPNPPHMAPPDPSESIELEVECQQLLHKTRELSERASSFGKTLQAQEESLRDQAEGLNREIQAKLAAVAPGTSSAAALETARSIFNGNGPGGDLAKYVDSLSKRPVILDWFHGTSIRVLIHRKDRANKLKEEYRSFRSRCAVIMFSFAAVLQMGVKRSELLREANEELTLLPVVMVGVQFFLCWLLFFYTATALRESVLKVNGSRIRPWWIQHHYWSMATCVLMLSLPIDSPTVVGACQLFLWWAMMQGVVMVMQNRYQRRRLYTKIALGNVMSNSSDVIGGESSGSSGQLYLLYPLLFAMQGLQFYIGIGMFSKTQWSWHSLEGFLDPERPGTDLWGSRGVALAGIMMMLMGIANAWNTIETIVVKGRRTSGLARKRV